jgi:FHA domain
MSDTLVPGPRNAPVGHSGTVLETEDEIRKAVLVDLKYAQAATALNPPSAPVPVPVPAGLAASPYRPTIRPPVPILTIFDDGKTEGEVIRIRSPRFTVGRSEGDLRFPLDGRMSSSHVEITHQVVDGLHRWVVTDLRSTHGMFVRVSKTVLADRAEILVGNGRYRFESNKPGSSETAEDLPGTSNAGETQGLDDGPGPFRPPSLTELLGKEIGNRLLLIKDQYWIGSDPSCALCRADDPFCEPKHVRLHRNSKGVWGAEHNKTQNGLWLRMVQIAVDSMIQFQVGEQRFRLKV